MFRQQIQSSISSLFEAEFPPKSRDYFFLLPLVHPVNTYSILINITHSSTSFVNTTAWVGIGSWEPVSGPISRDTYAVAPPADSDIPTLKDYSRSLELGSYKDIQRPT